MPPYLDHLIEKTKDNVLIIDGPHRGRVVSCDYASFNFRTDPANVYKIIDSHYLGFPFRVAFCDDKIRAGYLLLALAGLLITHYQKS